MWMFSWNTFTDTPRSNASYVIQAGTENESSQLGREERVTTHQYKSSQVYYLIFLFYAPFGAFMLVAKLAQMAFVCS